MKIKIWSDIRCPFCYIGKRKFEKALNNFPQKDQIEVVWKSFELDPSLKTQPGINVYDHFAMSKGVSKERALQTHDYVMNTAKETGLQFNFDKAVVANSFNAHRVIHLAKTKQLGNDAEEQFFKAYFIEGKNIDDTETLVEIGNSIGLDEKEIRQTLSSDAFKKEVYNDEAEAQEIGIRGVPFFVFNDRYAVSGAQAPETFLQALQQSFEEFEKEIKKKILVTTEGESCSIDGTCD
jgi:predicted DsbA family dithiol-disulfide isomerase